MSRKRRRPRGGTSTTRSGSANDRHAAEDLSPPRFVFILNLMLLNSYAIRKTRVKRGCFLLLCFFKHLSLPGVWIVFLKLDFPLHLLTVLAGVVHVVGLRGLKLYKVILRHSGRTLPYSFSRAKSAGAHSRRLSFLLSNARDVLLDIKMRLTVFHSDRHFSPLHHPLTHHEGSNWRKDFVLYRPF